MARKKTNPEVVEEAKEIKEVEAPKKAEKKPAKKSGTVAGN